MLDTWVWLRAHRLAAAPLRRANGYALGLGLASGFPRPIDAGAPTRESSLDYVGFASLYFWSCSWAALGPRLGTVSSSVIARSQDLFGRGAKPRRFGARDLQGGEAVGRLQLGARICSNVLATQC